MRPVLLATLMTVACYGDKPIVGDPVDSSDPSTTIDDSDPPDPGPSDADDDGYDEDEDCDDENADVFPGAEEVCNDLNDDCDGEVDEGLEQTWYQDADGDGFGSDARTTEDCDQPAGYADNDLDCDDGSAQAFPGGTEVCDGLDNDCDGEVDEDVVETFYWDLDGDGWGIDDWTTDACDAPSGYADQTGDCDDNDANVNPGETEVCNTIDDDCSGVADDGGVCPCTVDYYPDYDHPYLFCEVATDWTTAEAECAAYGYALVTFDSEPELSWVTTAVGAYTSNYWWIGFTDDSTEGSWEWEDASVVGYENWCSSEPNNTHGRECVDLSEEDCAMLNWGSGGCWNDYPCSCDWPYYICEGASEYRPD